MASTTPTVTRKSALLDSDDDDDDDEMSSNGEISGSTVRARIPRGRYSPPDDKKERRRGGGVEEGTQSRMGALSIDTHRNTDLNADGSAPSSSSAPSSAFLTPDINRPVSHRKRGPHTTGRRKKRRSPSSQNSQGETELDSDDEDQRDADNMLLCIDDPSYKVTDTQRAVFGTSQEIVQGECEFSKAEISEFFKNKDSQARLPELIQIGTKIMKTWYGSPFPAEFINVRQLFICEFCFFYARSDMIMQNHAKRCKLRAPPGVEIYRKDDVSVFEVDGRRQKSYCQTLCLISRMFLESKTVFYDTEPFFFYVATKNDHLGCHFTGYFSKEKYEPDVNNLSCIMTLPCFQEKGYGRFLIDLSYALSRREGWNGGPEQPLSDLGKKAYGGYWKNTIAISLVKMKNQIEYGGEGICVGDIADDTGINSHDVLSVVCSLGWAKIVEPKNGGKVCTLEWDVDWDVCHAIDEQKKKGGGGKTQFDESRLDWNPRKMKPHMDGFHELTKEEIEEDEQRRKSLQKTPIQENMETATPTSSSCPLGSVKKELRSRGHNRTVGRNLKLELTRKVKVPEVREITDDETKEEEKNKFSHKKRRSFPRCADDVTDPLKRHEGTPDDDDDQPGPSSKPVGRRPRSTREQVESTASASEQKTPNGRGRYRRRGGQLGDSDEPTEEDEPGSTDEEEVKPRPLIPEKGKVGGSGEKRGRKPGRKRKSVSGKKFPPNFGLREEKKEEDSIVKNEEEASGEVVAERKIEEEEMKTMVADVAGSEAEEVDLLHVEPIDEDMVKNYDIGTPESYHSTSPSPAPPEMPNHFPQEPPAEEAPPLLISEVNNLTVTEPVEPMDEGPAPPPLIADTYPSEDDDDVPPNLSPQYEKNEVHEEEMAPLEHHTPTQHSHNGLHQEDAYHDPMSAGPSSSMHVTPQMMPGSNHHYSQPNSHQQATPGSGGIPSCGGPTVAQSTYSTPEQQNQQFMSPQMAGMPASVSSVHSVHNNNSMEMVGGPASLQQHTPQQQYDIMGQMPQDNNVMVNNVATMDQMMQQQQQRHGFNSPPMPPTMVPQQPPPQQVPTPQQLPPQLPPQVAPIPIPAPAATNGRRRSETTATAGARKQRQRSTATPAVTANPVPPMPYNPMMMQPMPMATYPFGYPTYPAYPPMAENGFNQYYNYYQPMFTPVQQMDPHFQRWQQMAFNQQQMPDGNGAAAARGAVNYPFPPGTGPYFQNNTR